MEKKPRTKKDIRRQILAVRRTLPVEEAKEKSREIFQKVTAHPWYIEADTVFCYASHDGEVRTRELMDQILADGKRLALPRVESRIAWRKVPMGLRSHCLKIPCERSTAKRP